MWWYEKKFVPEHEFEEGPFYNLSLNKVTIWVAIVFYSTLLAITLNTETVFSHNNFTMMCIAPILARLTAIDLKHQLLLNVYVLPLFIIGLINAGISPNMTLLSSITGAAISGGSLLALNLLLSKINNKNNIGGGDIKFCFAAGAFIGLEFLPYFFWLSFFIALIMYPLLKAKNKYISFGPALIFSLWILLCIHNYFY